MADFAELLTCLMIFTLLSSSYGTECQASTESLKMVKSCPENETHWKTRANGMKCDSFESTCPPESRLTYHCVLNQWSNGTVEICAPTWFISGYCAMFSLDEKRIKDNFSLDCTKFTKQCPPRYISTDAYKYKSCYEIVSHDETDRKSTKNKPSVSVVSVLIPIAVVVPLLLVIVIGIIIFSRWKKKRSRMRNTAESQQTWWQWLWGIGTDSQANVESKHLCTSGRDTKQDSGLQEKESKEPIHTDRSTDRQGKAKKVDSEGTGTVEKIIAKIENMNSKQKEQEKDDFKERSKKDENADTPENYCGEANGEEKGTAVPGVWTDTYLNIM